jgi:hypothetical protein
LEITGAASEMLVETSSASVARMLDQHGADHLAADQGGNARHVALERAANLAGHQVAVAPTALVRAPAPDRHAGLRIDVFELELAV